MNKLIEITKEITRLWKERSENPYKELKTMGYNQEDISTVIFILRTGNDNMMEGRNRGRAEDINNRGDSDKWTSYT